MGNEDDYYIAEFSDSSQEEEYFFFMLDKFTIILYSSVAACLMYFCTQQNVKFLASPIVYQNTFLFLFILHKVLGILKDF